MRILILPLLVLPIALSGCSAVGTSTGEPATDSPTASAIATESPEIVTPAVSPLEALNGQTVALNAGDFYDVVLPAGSADAWTATVETPGIVEWMPVEPAADGSPVSTLATIGVGTTVVTITDGTTSVSFTVTVSK
jgi:hypothetical protein